MGRLILSGVLGVLAISASARADSWPAATVKEVFSESREWFVRVTPGKSLGDTVGFAGSAKGPYATAEFYRRRADRSYAVVADVTLVNPIAPVQFVVTNHGYLVTLDNWHNRGYGKVLASYDPTGKLIAAYTLAELFSAEEIRSFSHSTSSIHWRDEMVYVRQDRRSVYVLRDDKGKDMVVDPAAGAWQICEYRGTVHQCRDTNDRRQWRAFREPEAPR